MSAAQAIPEPTPREILESIADELERTRPDGLTQARRIGEVLEALQAEAATKTPPPALGEEAWCQRCGYPNAGHGTWEKCGGWL